MAEINNFDIVDDSNVDRFPEGMAASAYNNNARKDEGILARWHKDTNGSISSGGTGDVVTLAANRTISAYYDGLVMAYDATDANTGAVTLNVDGIGASAVVKNGSTALAANDIKAGQKVVVIYDGTNWQMISPVGNAGGDVFAANNGSEFTEATFKSNLNMEAGVDYQAYDADIVAKDVANVFTAQQTPLSGALTFNGTSQTWDCSAAQDATLTLTGNITTFAAPTNQVAGTHYSLRLTGAFSVTAWNAVFKFPAATAPTLTAGSTADILTFRSDGTNMELTGISQNV